VPRRLACLLAALAFACAASASAAAKHEPHPRHHKRPPVSAGVPYIAPWQSGFERYSTQVLTMPTVASNERALIVPTGQWWRIIVARAQFFTSAVVGNRQTYLEAKLVGVTSIWKIGAPRAQPASAQFDYAWGPQLGVIGNVDNIAFGMQSSPIPDMLLPPKCVIDLYMLGVAAGDGINDPTSISIEVYTPVKDRPGVFLPAPITP
jgi:hypothetical protein